jgi:hypothetical protein
MALSLSAAARGGLRDLLICFSVGNLCFLRRWYDLEHLKERSMDYYRSAPADLNLLWATLISAFLLTAVLWLAWCWVRRYPSPARLKLARCGFLFLLIFPLESVRRYWNEETGHADLGSNIALLSVEGLLITGLVMILFGNTRVLAPARHVALMLALLFPSLMIDLTVSRVNAEPASAFLAKPSLPMLPSGQAPQRRVIWMLFDELDQRLAFDARQPSVELPELDRLRAESFVASHATQTAPWTIIALPSLLSGRVFSRAELVDADTLRVYPEGSPQGLNWRDENNVFKQARALGVNAELVGWHHPYCRVFGDSMVRCLDVPGGHPTDALLRELNATDQGVLRTVASLFRLQLENALDMLHSTGSLGSENLGSPFVQRRQLEQYFLIRDRGYAAAADPRIGFLFVHFPAPHLFAIYDRKRGDFTLSAATGYFDNLALVDRTVGEMRRTLERAGLWENTSIVITADHGLRPELWRGRYNWTPELQRLTKRGASDTVPLIVKLAGGSRPLDYDKPFSNVVTGALGIAILSGQVSTASEIAAWLDHHSTPPVESRR